MAKSRRVEEIQDVRPQVWLGATVIFAACVWVGRAERQRPGEVPVSP